MHKRFEKNIVVKISLLVLIIICAVFIFSECRNASAHKNIERKISNEIQLTSDDGSPSSIRFLSFQNPDSTWGFTIFVNSRPFLHYKKIPVTNAEKGFASRKDAESVASVLTKMIKNGDTSPILTKKTLDTLGILLGNK